MFDERFNPFRIFGGKKETGVKIDENVTGDVIGTGLGEARVERIKDPKDPDKTLVRRVVETGRLLENPKRMQRRNDHVKKTWTALVASNIPTVRDLQFAKDPRIMYMEDLSREGKSEVISTPDFGIVEYKNETRKGKFYDQRETIKFEIKNIQELNQNLATLYQQLLQEGFHILPKKNGNPSANMFYLVIDKQTQIARVLLWDLTRVKKEMITDQEQYDQIAADNRRAFATFVERMNKYLTTESQLELVM